MTRAPRPLGKSGITVSPLGVGTNRWGDAPIDALTQTFTRAVDAGITLVDTAEIYGLGKSETNVGAAMRASAKPVTLMTKFAPVPTRLSSSSLLKALDRSLARLGVSSVDLYLVHFPFTLLRIESLMDAMAEAHKRGKIKAVGVSNFSAAHMHRAADALAKHNIPLAANEVHYSLVHRHPEENGVLDACRALDVALIAYFPLASGMLTKPLDDDARLGFTQRRKLGRGTQQQLVALQHILKRIATERSASMTQVALNWLLQRDPHVIAIPGATKAAHVDDVARTLAWTLSDTELAEIERASSPFT